MGTKRLGELTFAELRLPKRVALISASPDTSIGECISLLCIHNILSLPVYSSVERGKVVAILGTWDLLGYVLHQQGGGWGAELAVLSYSTCPTPPAELSQATARTHDTRQGGASRHRPASRRRWARSSRPVERPRAM
jgi:hypothetical protein